MTEKTTFKSVAGAACIGLAIGSLAWALTVWGQQTMPIPPSPQDPTTPLAYPQLGPAKTGVITQAQVQGRTVWIDGTSYQLASGMMIEDENGTPVQDRDIAGNRVAYKAQYWLGMGTTKDKIVRLIVFFPR
jgi:hypothetical protein